MKRFFLFIAATALAASAMAQSTISGSVFNADHSAAAGALVTLQPGGQKTITDDNGKYILKGIENGSYVLKAALIGSAEDQKQVTLSGKNLHNVDFSLSENIMELNEVVLQSQIGQNETPSNIGKISIKPMDLPQSVTIVGKNVMERQQSLRLSDVISNVSGIYVYGTSGGTQEEIGGRGYAFGSSSTFKNGVRYNNSAMPEVSSLERVEVLKGSAAILYGNVSAGGVLNLVTKKPSFVPGGEVALRAGSYGFYKPFLDLYGPVFHSDHIAFRINGSYEKADSYRDFVSSERIYVNPSILFKAGKKTTVLLEGDYLKDHRTLDYGTGAINYAVADIPRSRFLGAEWSRNKVEQSSATLTIQHQLNSSWKISGVSSIQNYRSDLFGTSRPNTGGNMVKEDGTWVRGITRSAQEEQYMILQLDLSGQVKTGKLHHNILIGADADKYLTDASAYSYSNPNAGNKNIYDTVNIFDPATLQRRGDIPLTTATTLTHTPTTRVGFYAQDLISLSEKVKFLAGIRYTIQSTLDGYVDSVGKDVRKINEGNKDAAFSPRLGLVYQPAKTVSLFASYSNSFTLNSGTDIYLKPLDPSYIDQFETGIKTELFHKLISANLTVYLINNSNLAQMSLTDAEGNPNSNSSIKELAGEVRSKGVELDIISKDFNGLQLMAGYSYNQSKYTKSNTYIVGSKLRYNPEQTAYGSAYYSFDPSTVLNGFNLGLKAYYIGERVAGRSTRVQVENDTYKLMPVPDYFQFDAFAGYRFKHFSVQAKVSNIFNKLSYYVHDDNSVNPIAPRMFSASVSYKF